MAKIVVCLKQEDGYEGNLAHTYMGAWKNENRLFVKSFINNKVKFTYNEEKAKNFFLDKECDECMAQLVLQHNAWTIAIWSKTAECVHYPNEHWKDNGCLQPSFIHRKRVEDFYKENIKFDRKKGWIKKWDLKDAKIGDIVVSGQITILFKEWADTSYNFLVAFAGIDISGNLQITDKCWLINNNSRLATENEKGIFFSKLEEKGYKWDSENKKLIKEK